MRGSAPQFVPRPVIPAHAGIQISGASLISLAGLIPNARLATVIRKVVIIPRNGVSATLIPLQVKPKGVREVSRCIPQVSRGSPIVEGASAFQGLHGVVQVEGPFAAPTGLSQ